MQLTSALERRLDVETDIAGAEVTIEVRRCDDCRRLLARTAEQQRPPRRTDALSDLLQRFQSGGVDRGHVAEPNDHDRRQLLEASRNDGDFVGGPEEERPVDPEDGDVGWNRLILQTVWST